MTAKNKKTFHDVIRECGRYPEEAFIFLREGLGYAVDKTHGPMNQTQQALQDFMTKQGIDVSELSEHYHQGHLPEELVQAIAAAGGLEKLNRHVSGHDLCWALREFAIRRWGPLARLVLDTWNIRETLDFGRIVFALVDNGLMQKEPQDSIHDFEDVYDFASAFSEALSEAFCEDEDSES